MAPDVAKVGCGQQKGPKDKCDDYVPPKNHGPKVAAPLPPHHQARVLCVYLPWRPDMS